MKCLGHLLFYHCDTDGGSSGGPVFKVVNKQLQLIALHRAHWGDNKFNFGTLITKVIDHVSGGPAACEYVSLLNLFMMIVAIGMNYGDTYSETQQRVK